MKKLKINEIFYSLQGEGGNQGMPMVFIRLAGCNLRCDFCDTDFSFRKEMSVQEIYDEIKKYAVNNICWTGGEPTLQLTSEHIDFFNSLNYWQALESNGTKSLVELEELDYITISPKGKIHPNILFIDEIRIPFENEIKLKKQLDFIEQSNIIAKEQFISPLFLAGNNNALEYGKIRPVVEFCKTHPEWRLSVQIHKLLKFE